MTAEPSSFSKREREMMDILYRHGSATAAEILTELAEPPSYSAVRTTLAVLERKGHLEHEIDGTRYVYRPTVPATQARQGALDHLLTTFFAGSPAGVVSTLLEQRAQDLSSAELDHLAGLIEQARKDGR